MTPWAGILLWMPFSFATPTPGTVEEVRQNLSVTEMEHRQMQAQFYEVSRRLKDAASRRARVSEQVLMLEGDVAELNQTMTRLQERVARLSEDLRSRMRRLYIWQGQGAARLLFSAQSTHALERDIRYLKRVSDQDLAMTKLYHRSSRALAVKRRQLEHQTRRLASAKRRLERLETELAGEQRTQAKILQRLQAARAKTLDQLKDLRVAQMANGVSDPSGSAFFERKGELKWPVQGVITTGFGTLKPAARASEGRIRLTHKGIKLRATAGAAVSVVHGGVVAFADRIGEGQFVVIVDHGDHYYTVYSPLERPMVKAGETIAEHAVLGRVVESDGSGMGEVHFEVRHFSDALDPKPWLASGTQLSQGQPQAGGSS